MDDDGIDRTRSSLINYEVSLAEIAIYIIDPDKNSCKWANDSYAKFCRLLTYHNILQQTAPIHMSCQRCSWPPLVHKMGA